MKNKHYITLPLEQAKWWSEICTKLGIENTIFGNQVLTITTDSEREIAWQLFREEFERLIINPGENNTGEEYGGLSLFIRG